MNDDSELRALFRTTLRADANAAPNFDRLWSTVSSQHHRRQTSMHLLRLTAIAALVLIGAFVSFHKSVSPGNTASTGLPWRSVVLLGEWQAPTDALLSQAETDSFSLDLHH